jgi:hypothetical protein
MSNNSRTGGISLNAYVKLFPTPDTRGFTNRGSLKMLAYIAESEEEFTLMAYRAGAKKKKELWPTPTANDAKNSLTESQRGRGTLTASVVEAAGVMKKPAGRLNADWVERLMGYPDGWTDTDSNNVNIATRYPAAWLDGSWDTIPRVVTGQKRRQARLKALGNAIVPQIAAYLWTLVKGAL